MATVTGLTTVKQFTYRGDPNEEFSNTYHFKNAPPVDSASWVTLMNQVLGAESKILPSTTHFVRVYGYDSDDPNAHHVFAQELAAGSVSGVYAHDAQYEAEIAGDQAAMVWWKTSRLNARGKPIYLRKYIHSGYVTNAAGDNLSSAYVTALSSFVNLTTGINAIHGGLRSRSHDETIVSSLASPYVTTRTLKRRGKRPKTGS